MGKMCEPWEGHVEKKKNPPVNWCGFFPIRWEKHGGDRNKKKKCKKNFFFLELILPKKKVNFSYFKKTHDLEEKKKKCSHLPEINFFRKKDDSFFFSFKNRNFGFHFTFWCVCFWKKKVFWYNKFTLKNRNFEALKWRFHHFVEKCCKNNKNVAKKIQQQ